ncbi:hypothetical protein Taro_041442 [Colocasia esculenta]|uniref:Uncharacterized protein n=1 Tax=Colocasia esculenta TaxID=4460 RepID=A0A843X0J0_COLES|nr:hypothetical protein [Colocasia esculenta]
MHLLLSSHITNHPKRIIIHLRLFLKYSIRLLSRQSGMPPTERDKAGITLFTSHGQSTDPKAGNLPTFVKNVNNEAGTMFPPLHVTSSQWKLVELNSKKPNRLRIPTAKPLVEQSFHQLCSARVT